jgi:hypothetical protein
MDRAKRDREGAEILFHTGMLQWIASIEPSPQDAIDCTLPRRRERALNRFATPLDSFTPRRRNPRSLCGRTSSTCSSRVDTTARARVRISCSTQRSDSMPPGRARPARRSVAGSWAEAQVQLAADRPTPDEYFPAFRAHVARVPRGRRAGERDQLAGGWPIRYAPYPRGQRTRPAPLIICTTGPLLRSTRPRRTTTSCRHCPPTRRRQSTTCASGTTARSS